MSEKLCTLRGAGGGGGRYTETSLWTNSAPTSDFAGQDVTLSESFDNYKYVKVRYKLSKTNNTEAALIVTSDDLKKSLGGDNQINMNFGGRTTTTRDRIVRYVNSTTLTITVAYHLSGTTTSTSDLIPLEILGLNELDHGIKTTTNTEVFPLATVAGGTQPTYTTKGRAVAIWQMWGRTDNVGFGIRTNVNPTTGAINNNEIYMSQNSGMSWTIQTAASFTVTDTTITTTAVSGNSRVVALAYTY